MRGRCGVWWVLVACVALVCGPAGVAALPVGQDPGTVAIGYQGVLTDAAGQPCTGTVPMQFYLYTTEKSGTSLWDSGLQNVAVRQGAFEVVLHIPQALLDGSPLWLAIHVDGQALQPRQPVLAAPYAAGLLPNVSVSGGAGDVLAATNTGTGSALRGSSPSGTGVYGLSDRGRAVFGENAGSKAGEGYGGYFTSSTGVGVYGGNTAEASTANPSAPGVQGYSLNGYGVLGESASAARAGVAGRSQLGTGVLAESANGVGLEAIGTNGLGLRVRSEAGIAADVESAQGPALVVRSRGTEARDHAGSFTAGNGNAVLAISTGSAAVRAEAGDTLAVPDEVLLAGVIARGKDAGSYSASENGSGVIGTSLGGAGVRGVSRTHYGGYFTSQDGRGLYVANLNGRQLDAYFGGDTGIEVAASARIDQDLVVYGDTRVYGDLQVSGRRVLNLTLAINAGPAALRRGDVVEVAGLADAPLDGAPVVLVRRTETASSHGVVGVVDCAWDPDGGFGAGSTVEIPAGGALGIATLGTFDGVRADASAGAIGIGDLLVSAPTAGHLQRADAPQPGTVVGKALEDLAGGTAQIGVFLTLE